MLQIFVNKEQVYGSWLFSFAIMICGVTWVTFNSVDYSDRFKMNVNIEVSLGNKSGIPIFSNSYGYVSLEGLMFEMNLSTVQI